MAKESAYFKLDNIGEERGSKELKRALDKYPGVISVSVNPEKDSLAVDFDSTGVKAEQLANRITKLGYGIVSQKCEEHLM